MQVTVKLFATLRHAAGWGSRTVDLEPGATVDDLLATLAAMDEKLGSEGRTLYAAVNQEYATGDQVLQDGDEVAIFPPVSGGAVTR